MAHAPDAFVVDAFIDYLEQKEKEFSSASSYPEREENEKKVNAINGIKKFLLASNINTDLTDDSIVKFYKKDAGNKKFTCLKEHIYLRAVKNQRMKNCADLFETAFENGSFSFEFFLSKVNKQTALYFIPCNTIKCKELEDKFGLIIIGTDFDFNGFYEDRKIVGKTISKEMDGIEVCKHPCNSLIIVDPYILSSRKGIDKTKGIIRTIKTFMPENLGVKFHLLILTKTRDDNSGYQGKINKILKELGGPEKIFIELYAPSNLFSDDRIILTNYSNINVGHPYDRDTYLNSILIFSDTDETKIRDNYSEHIKQCDLVRREVQNTPGNIGLTKTIFKTNHTERNRLLLF